MLDISALIQGLHHLGRDGASPEAAALVAKALQHAFSDQQRRIEGLERTVADLRREVDALRS